MSTRPLGILSGASRRLIALVALVVLLAAPSRGPAAFTVFNAPFAAETILTCGDGTKFVVGLEIADFKGILTISKNGRQVSYLEANIFDPVRKPLEERLADFCKSTGHSQSLSARRTILRGLTGGVDVDTGGEGAADAVGGDFNGDGLPDFAVANQGSNNVSILLNASGGTLQSGGRWQHRLRSGRQPRLLPRPQPGRPGHRRDQRRRERGSVI